MSDLLGTLFDTSSFPARWNCGNWTQLLGWTHIISDLMVWGAYTAIPLVLAYFVLTRPDISFPRIMWLFIAFIFACGTGHLVEATIFWTPWYRLSAAVKVATAGVSWVAVIAMVRMAPRALRLPSIAHMSAIVESSDDAILSTDLEGRIRSWNAGAQHLYGWTPEEMIGRHVRTLAPPARQQEADDYTARAARGEIVATHDTQRLHKDGNLLDVSLTVSPIRNLEGDIVGVSAIARDVSPRKRLDREMRALTERLEEEATHDPLTALANRRGLQAALARELGRQRRHGGSLMAVMIDMDDFGAINDRFGHAAGDVILRDAALRMAGRLRPSDVLGRIGGDEFLALLPDTRRAEARHVAERLRLAVSDSGVECSGKPVHVTACFGLAEVPGSVLSLEEVLTATRGALARGKREGKNRVSDAGGSSAGPQAGDEALDLIIRSQGLRVVAQPVCSLSDRRVVAYELLVRGPAGPYESPYDLFRLSLEHNALTAVDLNCFRTCLQAADSLPADIPVHLNLFPSTILETPINRLAELLEARGGTRRFCVEISEQQFLGDPAALRDTVSRLRERGVRFALDDVGFGRSSLEALIVLEPDVVKLDRACVHGLANDATRRQNLERMLRCVEPVSHAIIAEGLERAEDAQALQDAGVRLAQGWLLGRPVAVEFATS